MSRQAAVRAVRTHALRWAARGGRVLPGAPGDRARYMDTMDRMDRGELPSDGADVQDALLTRSDALVAAGRHEEALGWFDKALRLAYHPAQHYDATPSPLATDPAAFLAPFRAARLGPLLLDLPAHDPGPRRPAPRTAEDGAPVRLLVVAQRNWTFVDPVIESLGARGVEIRRFEVDSLPVAERPSRERVLRARLDLALHGRRLPTPAPLAEQIEWADVVLVEWGHHVLTWMSLLELMPRRTVARFHRFEVYTPFPLLTVYPVIDRVLFVSGHVRILLDHLTPHLSRAGSVLEVENFLAHGLGPEPGAGHDPHLLAQVGWVRPVKDVLFTLDLLERLREADPRFRLLLVGPGLPDSSADDSAHERKVRARLAALPAGSVQILGPRDDVPDVLAGAGWIVSSSLVEGVHEAVMEGLAAGCLPLVRDWPGARAYGGARTIYREDWVVTDVDAAAERVRSVLEDGDLSALSQDARRWVVARRSPEFVVQRYEDAIVPGRRS
ncbi:glycosyltransferase family 4 protein [Brachybacterium sp. NBEC-018]|uniref:glycosyltransferase family 4 protein n=1 Tax=Brachybacterium sp. NBEC-018 TaxID=2996004 RepID=UPI0021753EA7|nr:glycosyltransferase family 4 protein [Brachybacterium sp. NBEC-018]UVY82412.1 glycosyltransferase family 4 protein [Brachybacterium sp. NBEC-018]